jgi:hypothetical protein
MSIVCFVKSLPAQYFCDKTGNRGLSIAISNRLDKGENPVVHSFDFTPANVHDVNYLKVVKYNLNSCELIGDKGCISADYQLDLFNYSNIKLTVPTRKNQHSQVEFSTSKQKKRKRIETLISQLDGQFALNINFAKSLK